ncbi:putative dehydrogenase [Rhizobium petrolearium]|uniref:Gfo/Idh/MocA family protein n=1 Tax=Neorhizobium petrolearium TaxID=515361 RepID=UPI001AE318FD|nr:Gfo/Idh/MocA family oxidoreductase [Neorhizobium petrolearium]MBP1845187.1 putative dehydrogenase [Neorhizobium petrolearium]
MSDRIRVAVVGAGIGKAHVAAYATLPELFAVRYVCDLNLARAEEAAGQAPGSRAIGDINQVLSDPEVDLVDICLPPQLHATMTMVALEAGKHVVCEKPLAGSIADVRRIADLAAKMRRQVFPVFQYRYGAGYRAAHELKIRGLLGKPYLVALETHWQRGPTYYEERWRGTWKGELGGVLVSHACHIHNLMTHLVGDVTEIAAFLDTRVNPVETEDCAALSMRTSEGALVTSSVTLGAAGNSSRLRMCFEHVTVTSGTEPYQIGAGPWIFTSTDPSRQAEIDAAVSDIPGMLSRFPGLFADIHACLTGQPDLYLPTLQESYHSIELITAIYASARQNQIVRLPLGLDHPLAAGWMPQ